jgi:hypothetical protein
MVIGRYDLSAIEEAFNLKRSPVTCTLAAAEFETGQHFRELFSKSVSSFAESLLLIPLQAL